MHILIVASYYPTEANPVTGIFIEKQALMLQKAGHQVGVLVTPRLSATREELRRSGIGGLRAVTHETHFSYAADLPVYRMHWGWFPRPLPPAVTMLTRMAGIPAYQHYVKHHGKPDMLYAHDIFYGGYLAAVIRERFGIRAVLLEHSSAYQEGRAIFPGQPGVVRTTLNNTDVGFTVGAALIDALHHYVPEKPLSVLGNVVDTDFFTPGNAPPPEKPFRFTVIAQMKERRKGFDHLIAAFAEAFAGNPDVRLTLRGDGALRSEIEADVQRRGLSAQVEFLSRMSLDELRTLIRSSHAVVCSSTVETFNVSIAEAMACGIPVLTTICGGPEDYVTPETGILVEAGSTPALAEGMRRMAAEYERFDRAAARQTIIDRFSETALTARLEAAFKKV